MIIALGKVLAVVFVLFVSNGKRLQADTVRTDQTQLTDTVKVRTDDNGRRYPSLPANPKRLLYLQRSTNINAISYDIAIDPKTGKPDEDSPVHIYWLRYAEGHGEPSELTFLQRKFAYGVSSTKITDEKYDIRIMSYKKFPLTLMKGADGKYHIFATVSKTHIQVKNIFIQIKGGSLWSPNVVFIEVKGIDPVSGTELTERFKP